MGLAGFDLDLAMAADESKSLLPQNVLVLTKLEGEHVLSIVDQLDEQALVKITRQLGAILHTLHEIPFAAFGYVGTNGVVQPHRTNLDYIRFQFDEKLREFAALGGDPGLLDFENVIAGDPLLDLAKAHCYSRRRSEATLAALVDGYGQLRADWRQALDLYVVYHWLELWDWFASSGQTEALDDLAGEMRLLIAA